MKASPNILVVDDNRHNVRRLKTILASQGYEVTVAHSGKEALERVVDNPPDLVVLDVLMPGVNGFDVARALRARDKGRTIPILMVTALRGLDDRIKGLEAGADDFLSRPFNSIELLARVRSLLRIKQLYDEVQTRNTLLERILTRYVSEETTDQILQDPDQDLRLDSHDCQVSVLLADIAGFTRAAQDWEAAQITQTLNLFFHHLAATVFEHRGTLDKYLGNALLAFYGAPIPSPDHPERALRTAWAMQRKFSRLICQEPRFSQLGLSIGVASGQAIVGHVGAERMMDYTVIGRPPKVAKRLQEQAQPGQILIDEPTYQALQEIIIAHPIEVPSLNGSGRPARAFEVLAVKELMKA